MYFFFFAFTFRGEMEAADEVASWHLHLLNHRFRKLGGVLCGFSVCGFSLRKKQDASAGKESRNAEGKVSWGNSEVWRRVSRSQDPRRMEI